MKKLFLYILFLNASGILSQTPGFQWMRYSASGPAQAYGITSDRVGNVYVTGHFADTLRFAPPAGNQTLYCEVTRAFVSKMRPDGTLAWLKDVPYLEGMAIAADNNCNVFITGYFGFITKMDSSGNILWSKRPESNSIPDIMGWGIAVDNFGNVYGAGALTGIYDFDPGPGIFTLTPLGPQASYIWKLDANGNFVWAKSFGGGQCEIRSICIDREGNVLTTGNFLNPIDCDPGPGVCTLSTSTSTWASFVQKLDQNGNFVWGKAFAGTYVHAYSIHTDSNNDVYSAGEFFGINDFDPGLGTYSMSGTGVYDCYISKLSASGNFVWSKQIGGKYTKYARAIKTDISDDVWIGGYFSDSTGYHSDFDPGPGTYTVQSDYGSFILKLDKNGIFKTFNYVGDKLNVFATLRSLNVSNQASVYAAGVYNGRIFICKINDLTVGIEEINLEKAIIIYPNPAESSLYISRENVKVARIKIFSCEGQLKLTEDLYDLTTLIDISCLSSGLYLLKLEENNSTRTSKFLKQ